LTKFPNAEIFYDIYDPASILTKSRFAIISGGVITFECAFLNIPMIIIPIVENQRLNAKAWSDANFSISLRGIQDALDYFTSTTLSDTINNLDDRFKRKTKIIDGKGAERVAQVIMSSIGDI
jgi:spore coat polysaccharide biosynthesis predicted glycosyltransferase SpsG